MYVLRQIRVQEIILRGEIDEKSIALLVMKILHCFIILLMDIWMQLEDIWLHLIIRTGFCKTPQCKRVSKNFDDL